MSLRNKVNQLSSLLENERSKNEKLIDEQKKSEKIISQKNNEIKELKKNISKLEQTNKNLSNLQNKIIEHNKFKHFSYVCAFCRTVNIINTFNNQNEYRLNCKKCSQMNQFTFNFDYLYVLHSMHSNLLKIGYSERNPIERLAEINRATGSLVWELFAYHKTFTGKKLEALVFDCLRSYRVDKKEFFEISFEELVSKLNKEYSLQLIKTIDSP